MEKPNPQTIINEYIKMEISINELYEGLPCLIKNKEFFSPKVYTEPFLERMSKLTTDFRVQVKVADTLSTRDQELNKIYTRIWVQAVLPKDHCIDDHDEVIGFLYGIDVKKPVVKIYRGYLNRACTNLCVFNPTWMEVQEMIPGDPIRYGAVQNLLKQDNDFAVRLKKMKETTIDRNMRKNYLGEWVDYSLRETQDYGFGKVKIAVSTPIDAYKSLFIDQDSQYYIPEGIDPTLFDVHNSFTQIITNDSKDIMNKFEKTMIINSILGLN